MTTEEVLLTVLTIAIVILIAVTIAVLTVVFLALKKIKQATDHVEHLTARSSELADRVAPASVAAISMLQIARVLTKKRK